MGEFNFIEAVEKQKIFDKWLFQQQDEKKSGFQGNKLVLNNNRDLFYAVGNTIRMCTINSKTKNYRIAKATYSPFDVEELGLNGDGKFLYSTDFHRVIVQDLPRVVSHSKSTSVSPNSYELKGLNSESHILKIVWHPLISRGLGLVVLEADNCIKYYDLSLSESPRMVIDLNKEPNFKNQTATSISFGSAENIIGRLTLYISSTSSKIYAIYPFVGRKSKISLTKTDIERAIAETESIGDFTDYFFPHLTDDGLTEMLIVQENAISSLRKQLSGNPDEVKTLPNGEEEFYHSVDTNDYFGQNPHVQGPIADLKIGKIKDICYVGGNEDMSIISVINDDDTDLTVKYVAQLKPLVMAFDLKGDHMMFKLSNVGSTPAPTLELPSSPESSKEEADKAYKEPEVGFGYVDSDHESEPEGKKDLQVAPSSDDKTKQVTVDKDGQTSYSSKAEFWINNFRRMEEIATDIIPKCCLSSNRRILKSNIDPNRFLIHTPSKSIVCTPYEGINSLAELLIDKELKPQEPISDYKLIDHGKNSASVTFVRDDLTYTGDYVVAAFDEMERPVDLYKISEQDMPPIEKLSLETKDSEVKIESKIKDDMISEIQTDKQQIQPVKPVNYPINATDDHYQVLSTLNKFSKDTLGQVKIYSNLLIKLNLKVSSNLMELKYQIDMLNKLSNESSKESSNKEIEELKAKQLKLNQKLKSVHQKLISKAESLKVYKPIPLSNEEKGWFKEINQINAITGQNSSGAQEGLTKTITDLSHQVEYIKKHINSSPKNEEESLKYRSELLQIKDIVGNQWNSLNGLKSRIDGLVKNLEAKEETKA